jgi:hypothetical protein
MAAAVSSTSQTIANFQDEPAARVLPASPPSLQSGARAHGRSLRAAPEAMWPRAVIVLGLGLNVAWLGLLGWGLVEIVVN